MAPIRFRYQTIEFGDQDVHLRTLRDLREFQDEEGKAEALGISSSNWPLFGVVWASGQALARLMYDYQVGGRRILEVGCGIGLASLVLNQRASDITATDYHPEAGAFLAANVALNGAAPIPFERTGWADGDDALGRFDLIIGSDLLYDRGHARELSRFIACHARPACEVILLDPGRGQLGQFDRCMAAFGFALTRTRAAEGDIPGEPYRGYVLRFLRDTLPDAFSA